MSDAGRAGVTVLGEVSTRAWVIKTGWRHFPGARRYPGRPRIARMETWPRTFRSVQALGQGGRPS